MEAGKSDQSGQDSYVVIEDERINKILVSGMPAAVDEEHLELKFEKTGGRINFIEVDRKENTAVIEFDDPDGRFSYNIKHFLYENASSIPLPPPRPLPQLAYYEYNISGVCFIAHLSL